MIRGRRLARRVLLIGWDAADWQIIHPLMDRGLMPVLQRFVADGVMGNLASLEPMYSPSLWTSIATGKRMHKHGVYWFIEPDADGRSIDVARSTTRRCKAFWNILTQAGLETQLVGWLTSHPAEPIAGVCVTDAYPRCSHETLRAAEPQPEMIHPAELSETLLGLRIEPADLSAEVLAPFGPLLTRVDPRHDDRIAILAKLIAECSNVHNAITWLLEQRPWDCAAVYYDAIDHFGHGFMACHPPKMAQVSDADFELYQHVMTAAYRFHDMMLGRLLELAGEDTTVILLSDHGFRSDRLRPRVEPEFMGAGAVWHRYHGVFAMKGPHVRKDEWLHDLSLLDITPTLLTLFGLPVGDDMDGKPLVQVFEHPPEILRIPSWEEVPGECGRHPPDRQDRPFDNLVALQQLIALGYIEPLDKPLQDQLEQHGREAQFALASDYFDAGLPQQAVPLLEALTAVDPGDARYILRLAQCYQSLGRFDEARALLRTLLAERGERPGVHLLLGSIELAAGALAAAEQHLERAAAQEADSPHPLPWLWICLGRLRNLQRRWEDALAAFEQALCLDPELPAGHFGKATTALCQGRLEDAARHALQAISLRYHFHEAHYLLGVALARGGERVRAAEAFRSALRIDPQLGAARCWLAWLAQEAPAAPPPATEIA
jgi:predicted AlkP superfamily phosphohydrolase/phosphomutase/tetratricopeptide (TPR) repeat protein